MGKTWQGSPTSKMSRWDGLAAADQCYSYVPQVPDRKYPGCKLLTACTQYVAEPIIELRSGPDLAPMRRRAPSLTTDCGL